MTSLTKIKTNEKQEKFLDNLISNGGNITKACVDAGYSPNTTNWLMRKLKDEIIEKAESVLAAHSPKAALGISRALSDDGSLPGANIRMEAAKQILDRVGLVKREKIDVNAKVAHGIFVLPAKEA